MIFELRNGAYGYDHHENLYSDVNFKLQSGEILAILGVNGSGKTTLLKCLLGFLKLRSGGTYINNKRTSDIPQGDFWKMISYVPQAKGVAPSILAEEMVLLGRSPYIGHIKQPKNEDYQAVDRAMTLLDINHLAQKKCSEMSGGELQMVLIARAIVSNPKLIILDEPESNLDFKNQLVILDTLKMLVESHGMMCIINTHYPENALKLADQTLMIDVKSRQCVIGATHDIINKENLERTFDVHVQLAEVDCGDMDRKVIVPLSLIKSDAKNNLKL